MQPPPFRMMNREERHLCAILYHLLMDADNLRAFLSYLGLPPVDDVHLSVEAAFVRDYFNWWRQEYRRRGKASGKTGEASREFDEFCEKTFMIDSAQASRLRAPDGFLSLRLLHGAEPTLFRDPCCALLPSLANMRLDMLLVAPAAFVVFEAKLHSPLAAMQIYLQQALGRILNRLPGYEQHKFYHFLVSRGTTHPRLRAALRRCEVEHSIPVKEPKAIAWRQVIDCLPHMGPREREEIEGMLRVGA